MKLASATRHTDLYPDRHLNVFVPYQTHDLDYNVTRALISTLRWSRPELTEAFLQSVSGVEAGSGGSFHYDLHSCDYEDFDPAQVEKQVLLGISRAGRLATRLPVMDDPERSMALLGMLRAPVPLDVKLAEVRRVISHPELSYDEMAVLQHSLEEREEGCTPDGWVFSKEAGVCVLIEAKLLKLLDLYQIQRYGDVYFGREFSEDEVKLATWEDVGAFFAKHKGDDDPRTAFLCSQLCDYLDLLGLSAFTGFRPYDFDSDTAQEALPKFQKFVAQLKTKAGDAGLGLGETYQSPTGVRIAFSDPELLGELRVDLLEAGIRVEHRVGDATSGRHPGREALDTILARSKSEEGELNPLSGADLDTLQVRIERLRSDQPTGPAFVELETLKSELEADAFDFVLSELRRQHPESAAAKGVSGHYRRAALSIGRMISREDLLGDGAAATDLCLGALKAIMAAAHSLTPSS
jgi:hypothetical protein